MSHSLLLLKVLNDTSADGKISDDNVEILESMAYSSALFGMLQGKKFKNEPWIDFLNEMHEYLLLHPRRNDTPVIIELKKMLNDVLYQPAPTLKDWSKKPPLPLYDVSSSSTSTGICVKPISPPTTSFAETDPATISSAIASLCGSDLATSDRYEARNDALRAIARERNLASNDVAALVSWLASTNDVQRVERLAANLSLVRLTGDSP